MKTVGVVIPIYNAEKYLRECLDSVINQTYVNLEIILVNDGSTDKNSLNIAKEYTLKDKRITLFDKKNGGQSTARNVGIEYFNKEYKLKNKTKNLKENSLIEFNIDGNNPYEIYTVYKSYQFFKDNNKLLNFKTPDIDYIIFLDSDDYWELNCIEECVPRMDGVEVVWFDNHNVNEIENFTETFTRLSNHGYTEEQCITSGEWAKKALTNKEVKDFAFVWQGLISFKFLHLIKLKFLNYVIHQDHHFGILLFTQSEKIYILPKKLLYYRIRTNSSVNHDKIITKANLPSYLDDIYQDFSQNPIQTKMYHKASSWMIQFLEIFNFLKNIDNKYIRALLKYKFLPSYAKEAIKIKSFKKDPLKLQKNIFLLKPYLKSKKIHKLRKTFFLIKNKYKNFILKKYFEIKSIFQLENIFSKSAIQQELIISLTSYPKRIDQIHYTLYSLLTQSIKAHKIILYLSDEEFINKEQDLPKKVLDLQKYGIKIKWCKNIKSYKKIIFALKDYPNHIIVTADDDIIYPKQWLEKLYNSYLRNPENIHCHRAYKISLKNGKIQPYHTWEKALNTDSDSYLNFPTSGGGILYPPSTFYKDISKECIFMKLCPNADDIWLWAMTILNDKSINIVKNNENQIKSFNDDDLSGTLWRSNILHRKNDQQLQNVLKHYPEIYTKLK